MFSIVALCLCVCAATSVTEGKPSRRGEKPKSSRHSRPDDAPEYDDGPFLPGSSSQCLVNGISLFEGAAWSPKPCTVCQCRSGAVICRSVPCPNSATNTRQAVGNKGRRPTANKSEEKVGVASRTNLYQRHAGNVKPSMGKGAVEAKQKKAETLVTPARSVAAKKQTPTQKKKQEVVVKTEPRGGKLLLVRGQESIGGPKIALKANKKTPPPFVKRWPVDDDDDDDDYVDDDSDDDDDDDYGNISKFLPTGRPAILPTGRPVMLPTGRRVNTRPVITRPAQRRVFMESLPSGCLLSEYLIACGSTGMTRIPILHDIGVTALYLADNKISKIPPRALAGVPNLEWLDLSKNKLGDSSLSPDTFQNLTKLRRLNLDGNNLTKVPALPPSLVELKINDNKLMGLTPSSFKGLSQLLTLELEDNHFHDGNVSPLTFRPLRKLIYLRLDDNNFRAIPSGLPASLQELHLSDNRVEEVHAGLLNKTIHLRVLDLSHNKIREDRIAPRAWIYLLKLESLDLSYNKLVHVPSFLPVALRLLRLHHNQIERIPGYVFGHMRPGLDSLLLSYNRLREDGISEVSFLGLYQSLTELLLDHNQLRAIPRGILQLKALQQLRLNSNYISYVPMDALCDTRATEDSPLVSVHLENNVIDRRLIPPTAFSCIRTYHSVLLRPQRYEDHE